jgi:hypothetical protein
MPEKIDLFEAIDTQRGIRYFKPNPVPDELINRLLEAARREAGHDGASIESRGERVVDADQHVRRPVPGALEDHHIAVEPEDVELAAPVVVGDLDKVGQPRVER